MAMNRYEVLRRPMLTEKTDMLSDLDCVVFEVALGANKRQVKEAVEGLFEVKVKKVRTLIVPGKQRRWGRRITRTAAWKKAIVTLAPGERINLE
jgi:large subunit ribosomal protein L23